MTRLALRVVCVLLSTVLLLPPGLAAGQPSRTGDHPFTALPAGDASGMQAADILGVREQLDQLMQLQKSGDVSVETSLRMLDLRGRILRKVLLAILEVRSACNKLEIESALTYHALDREQRKIDSADEFFNLANFYDFGTLYTLEGASRIDKKFIQSRVFTCTGAGIVTTLPTLNILYDKMQRAHDVEPPKFLEYVLDDRRADDARLPKLISRFLDSCEPGTNQTRRQLMHLLWKDEYKADITGTSSFWNVIDGRSKPVESLHTRILILWSLHTFIEDFDRQLLALIKMIEWNEPAAQTNTDRPHKTNPPSLGSTFALLGIESQAAELIRLNQSSQTENVRRCQLETFVLYKVLAATLEVRVAINKIHAELNHAHNVVLSHLLARRKRNLQTDFEINFMQKGVFGATAGILYFQNQLKAGNEMFVVAGGIGTLMATVALVHAHGGRRKCDAPPNSLADFLDLETDSDNRFSPFISKFLNSPDPDLNTGVSRKQACIDSWQRDKLIDLDMRSRANRIEVADMPSLKYDTIRIARTRLALLHSVKATIESIDYQLLQVLRATELPRTKVATISEGSRVEGQLRPNAAEAATLLDVIPEIARIQVLKKASSDSPDLALIQNQLVLTGKIFSAQLETTATGSTTHQEITHETQVLARMKHARDLGVALTNNANFYQINILELIINGPLGLSTARKFPAGDRLTIVSGAAAIVLASAAFLVERRGGHRPSRAEPNMLAPCFDLNSQASSNFSPLLLKFLNSADPYSANKQTRREELINYWVQSKILSIDVRKPEAQEKLSATGTDHRRRDETIKLISDRIAMLYDLRTVVDLMDIGLADLLSLVD